MHIHTHKEVKRSANGYMVAAGGCITIKLVGVHVVVGGRRVLRNHNPRLKTAKEVEEGVVV